METPHVYRVSPWRRRALYGFCGLFTIPLAVGGLVTGETALLVTAALTAAIMLPISFWALQMGRLTLTAEGVELRQAGATLRSSWANVESIRLARGAEGFVLREGMVGRGAERYATTSQVIIRGAPLYDADRRQLFAEKRFIPIEAFAYWLHRGDLKPVLHQYVPELVRDAETAAAAAAALPPRRMSTAAILTASAIITLSIGAGLVMATRPDVGPAALNILLVVVALALAPITLNNLVSAVRLFSSRRFGGGLLWGSVAVIQALIIVQLLSGVAW